MTTHDILGFFSWFLRLKLALTYFNFIAEIENQFSISVKTIRTDSGVEFLMSQYFYSKGIIHQTTCIETPQQNGIVERKHQHLLNVTRALLFQSSLPLSF